MSVLLLMQVLRLMENEEIEPEEVDKDLRPMIDDYVDRSEEAFDEFGDVDGLYPAALIEQMDSLETQMPASSALQVSNMPLSLTDNNASCPEVIAGNVSNGARVPILFLQDRQGSDDGGVVRQSCVSRHCI